MNSERFFRILSGMLDSGKYYEEMFHWLINELDVPFTYYAVPNDISISEELSVSEMLEYIEAIRKGTDEPIMLKSELYDCLEAVLTFRHEFYKRSKDIVPEILENYYISSTYKFIDQYFNESRCEIEILPFEFDPALPVEYNLDRLSEFKKNAELVIKHFHTYENEKFSLIPRSLIQFGISKISRKNDDTEPLFDIWKRYLRVWDLVEEKEKNKRDAKHYLAVGNKIIAEFGKYRNYSPTDLRANIKKDYAKACQLIKSAEAGTFPTLKKSAVLDL